MTARREWLEDYVSFKSDKLIILGDNRRIQANDIDLVRTSIGVLQNVHYVPKLSANLVSNSAAADNCIEALYNKDEIQLIKNKQTLLTGGRNEDIYTLEFGIHRNRE